MSANIHEKVLDSFVQTKKFNYDEPTWIHSITLDAFSINVIDKPMLIQEFKTEELTEKYMLIHFILSTPAEKLKDLHKEGGIELIKEKFYDFASTQKLTDIPAISEKLIEFILDVFKRSNPGLQFKSEKGSKKKTARSD